MRDSRETSVRYLSLICSKVRPQIRLSPLCLEPANNVPYKAIHSLSCSKVKTQICYLEGEAIQNDVRNILLTHKIKYTLRKRFYWNRLNVITKCNRRSTILIKRNSIQTCWTVFNVHLLNYNMENRPWIELNFCDWSEFQICNRTRIWFYWSGFFYKFCGAVYWSQFATWT